jgi:hypothetical protein
MAEILSDSLYLYSGGARFESHFQLRAEIIFGCGLDSRIYGNMKEKYQPAVPHMRFEVVTAGNMKTTIFWDVRLCSSSEEPAASAFRLEESAMEENYATDIGNCNYATDIGKCKMINFIFWFCILLRVI